MSVLAASQAFSDTFGLLATFLGIGLLVNGIIVYIVVLVLGERRENREVRERRPGADATRQGVEPV
jgi:hypothetical protein